MTETYSPGLDSSTIQSASLEVLEQLLLSSRDQQKRLNEELDQFVLAHQDELETLYLDEDQGADKVRSSLAPLELRYEVLRTLHKNSEHKIESRQESRSRQERDRLEKQVSELDDRLTKGAKALIEKQFVYAYNIVDSLSTDLQSASARAISSEKLNALYDATTTQQASILSQATEIWSNGIIIDPASLRISQKPQMSEVIEIFNRTGSLKDKMKKMSQRLLDTFICPLLASNVRIDEIDDRLVLGETGQRGLVALEILLTYVVRSQPALSSMLRSYLAPLVVDAIQRDYLRENLPTQIQVNARIDALLHDLSHLNTVMKELGLLLSSGIVETINNIPSVWFERRRNIVLDECRKLVMSWTGITETIEQNENVTHEALMAPVTTARSEAKETEAVYQVEQENDDWGVDDWDVDEDDSKTMTDKGDKEAEDDADDAWGLDKELTELPNTPQSTNQGAAGTTVLLSTRYAVSTIPKLLLELINQCKVDADSLKTTHKDSPIASQSHNLLTIPSEILEIYRALVPLLITRTGYPRMTIYNDCIYLASQIDEKDISAKMQSFGERFYTLEIHEKRDQIQTILKESGGFVSITIPEQAELCRSLIQQVLDLLQRTQERYEPQLGRTTMFTALGTLVESALQYFVTSCTAMTDISEGESTELAALGDQLSLVEGLFKSDEEQGTVLAAMWCPTWFKFRLLLDILEAKLDYILQLWQDGDLVDYEAMEVVELIRALFSDSPKRRRAIDEILDSVAS